VLFRSSLLAFAPPAAAVTAPASAAERQMQALSVASAAVVRSVVSVPLELPNTT
jgi:hypothetical protein